MFSIILEIKLSGKGEAGGESPTWNWEDIRQFKPTQSHKERFSMSFQIKESTKYEH